jgi:hypothetical protein
MITFHTMAINKHSLNFRWIADLIHSMVAISALEVTISQFLHEIRFGLRRLYQGFEW